MHASREGDRALAGSCRICTDDAHLPTAAWPESPGRALCALRAPHGGITRRGPEGGASEAAEHYLRRGDTDMSLRGGKRAVIYFRLAYW